MPKKWGPLQGLPRNPKPLLRLLDETTLPDDTLEVGSLTLDRLPDITAPGHADVLRKLRVHRAPTNYLHEHLADARSVILPRTEWGHFGPLEQPEVVAAEILRALTNDVSAPDASLRSRDEALMPANRPAGPSGHAGRRRARHRQLDRPRTRDRDRARRAMVSRVRDGPRPRP